MTHTQTTYINPIALRAGKKGARLAEIGALASVFEKSATELNQKLLKCKQTIQIATFNVRNLNRICQLIELTASAVKHNLHTRTPLHSHRRYQISRNWQWMDAGDCIGMEKLCQCIGRRGGNAYWTKSAKTLNSIERIQPRIMVATFNGNPKATNISCYRPTNDSDETELVTFDEELSSLVRSIQKYNLQVIGGNMNAQIGKKQQQIQPTQHVKQEWTTSN